MNTRYGAAQPAPHIRRQSRFIDHSMPFDDEQSLWPLRVMLFIHPFIRRHAIVLVSCLVYVFLAGGYLLLVSHASAKWQARRQKLIEESPVVWVSPYGLHYHQQNHYGRHLSAPLSLYEATEWGYEYCDICHPPRPSQLLQVPIWVRHWLVILLASSCSWIFITLVVSNRNRRIIKQPVGPDSP